MKNIMKKQILFTALLSLSVLAFAAKGAGQSSVNSLNLDVGARYLGMGGVGTSNANDMIGVMYNPAVVGKLDTVSLAGSTGKILWDMRNNFVGVSTPIPFISLTGNAPTVIGVSGMFFDAGDDWHYVSGLSPVKRNFGKDMALSVTLSENILTNEWSIGSGSFDMYHTIGITGKYIKSELPDPGSADSVDGDAFAGDVGYMLSVPDYGFGFGVALLNAGSKIKYLEEKEDLPMSLRTGLSFKAVSVPHFDLYLAGDYIYYIKDEASRVRAGVEAYIFDVLAARGGYRMLEEEDDYFTLGFGLRLWGLEVDYGMILDPMYGGDSNQISVTYRFPSSKKKKEKEVKEKKIVITPDVRNPNPIIY
ncbi:hypothetical protein Dip518_000242 [Parelusimicrobium proximum]|uniref:PorV/PorQ family protein n=1 Tax=Parelusimicrobium proximum TaxID=3228953 RepID=UPI003D178604